MTKPFAVGDSVTVLPPFDDDPYIVRLQPHATVTAVLPREAGQEPRYMVKLSGASPADMRYGPFPAHRLAQGHGARS